MSIKDKKKRTTKSHLLISVHDDEKKEKTEYY
jgi:hypothetical protein